MMNLKVEIKAIFKNPTSPLKAIATVVLDDCFIIRNVKLIETEDATFISMPSYRGRDENWHSICHPITPEFREKLQTAVIEAYTQG